MRHVRTQIVGVAAALLLGLTACGSSSNDSSGGGGGGGGSEATNVVISAANSFEFLPAEYGIKLGFWKDRGLDVSNTYVSGGQFGQAMASGKFDVGLGGATSTATLIGTVDAPIVAGISTNYSMMVLVTTNDSGVNNIGDLKGKTVGITSVGSVTDSLVTVLRKKEGWSEADLKAAPVGGLDQQMAALKSGATSAFIWTAEAGYQLEEQKTGKILANFGDLVPTNVFEAIEAPRKSISGEPDKVQQYLNGYFQTIAYMKAHRDETVKFMMSQFKMDQYVAEHTYDLDINNLSTTGEIPAANLQGVADFAVATDMVKTKPSPDQFFESKFVPVDVAAPTPGSAASGS